MTVCNPYIFSSHKNLKFFLEPNNDFSTQRDGFKDETVELTNDDIQQLNLADTLKPRYCL